MSSKKASAKTKKANSPKPRQVRPPSFRSFRLRKRLRQPAPKLPGFFTLLRLSIRQLSANKKLFFGILGVYLILNLTLVKGFGPGNNLPELKASLSEIFTGGGGQVISGLALFGFLLGASGSVTSEVASVYQSFLLIFVSLAIIWALRQVHADKKVTMGDAFYKGMYPLVPFVLVLLIISLQLLPLLAGAGLYSSVAMNQLTVNGLESFVWLLVFGLLATSSLYMLSSSVFSLYIVTLPDVRPLQSLRSARGLVRYRRWAIMRRILLLPLLLLISAAVIMVPLIIFLTPLAEWVFFILTAFGVAVTHGYMYNLYRELLPNE